MALLYPHYLVFFGEFKHLPVFRAPGEHQVPVFWWWIVFHTPNLLGETSQAVLNPCRLRHTNPRHWISLGHGPKNTRIMIFLLVKIALLSAASGSASGRLAMAFAKFNHVHNPESNHTFVPTITPNEVPKLALSIVHWEGLSTPNKSSLFRAVPRGEHIFIYRSSNQKRSPLCGWFSVYNPTLIYGSSMDIFYSTMVWSKTLVLFDAGSGMCISVN